MGKTSAAVKNRYNAKKYDRINLTTPKEKKTLSPLTPNAAEKVSTALSTVR